MTLSKTTLFKLPLLHRFKRFYSRKTYYQILNLKPDCSHKEIKDAYILLTKKYHPDTSGGKYTKDQFLQVAEAYDVLGKPDSRSNYDLNMGLNGKKVHKVYYTDEDIIRKPWMNNTTERNTKFYESDSYYGVKGIKRVPNSTIVWICLLFVTIGVALQVIAIRNSMTLRRDIMLERSKIAQNNLREAREEAVKNGNDLQIELMKQRFEGRFGR